MDEPVYRNKRTGEIIDACEAEPGIEVITLEGKVVTGAGDMLTYHPAEHGYWVWTRAEFDDLYEEVPDGSLQEPVRVPQS